MVQASIAGNATPNADPLAEIFVGKTNLIIPPQYWGGIIFRDKYAIIKKLLKGQIIIKNNRIISENDE